MNVRRQKQAGTESAVTDARREGRAEILFAAAQAFMEHGYHATSIDTVAQHLGCTKGRIYYHYKSKADLFFDIHRRAMRMNIDTIAPLAAGEGSPLERLARMVQAHALLVMRHLPFQRVSVQGVQMHLAGSTTPEQRQTLRTIIDMRDQFEKHFVEVIAEGVAAGQLRALDPRLVVKPLLGALNWITVWYRERPEDTEESRTRLASEMTDVLLDGLCVRASARRIRRATTAVPPIASFSVEREAASLQGPGKLQQRRTP